MYCLVALFHTLFGWMSLRRLESRLQLPLTAGRDHRNLEEGDGSSQLCNNFRDNLFMEL